MHTDEKYPFEGRCFACGDYLVPVREIVVVSVDGSETELRCRRCDERIEAEDQPAKAEA